MYPSEEDLQEDRGTTAGLALILCAILGSCAAKKAPIEQQRPEPRSATPVVRKITSQPSVPKYSTYSSLVVTR